MDRKEHQQLWNKAHNAKKRAELVRLREIEQQYIELLKRVAAMTMASKGE